MIKLFSVKFALVFLTTLVLQSIGYSPLELTHWLYYLPIMMIVLGYDDIKTWVNNWALS